MVENNKRLEMASSIFVNCAASTFAVISTSAQFACRNFFHISMRCVDVLAGLQNRGLFNRFEQNGQDRALNAVLCHEAGPFGFHPRPLYRMLR